MIRFPLGSLYATPGALQLLADAGQSGAELIARHASGDWGDMCADDCAANGAALCDGSRIFSGYDVSGQRIWVITEAGRHATTLLLPDEY